MTTRTLPALALLLATAQMALADAPKVLATATVPLDGTAVSLPTMDKPGGYALQVSGTFRCDLDGREYDALSRTAPLKGLTTPHGLLVVEPADATVVERDEGRHRYVFGLPARRQTTGESFTVRLNVDALVTEFIRTPSEVRQSLSGDLKAELLFTPATPDRRPAYAAAALLALLGALVAGMMALAARQARQRPFDDVLALQRRVGAKCSEALGEIGGEELLFDELRTRVMGLRDGANELARHVVTFRQARLQHKPAETEAEIGRLEAQLSEATAPDTQARCRDQIAAKRATLTALRETEQTETRYLLRLAAAETAIDDVRLRLPHLRVGLDETGSDQAAVAAIDQELGLLQGAIHDIRVQAPLL